MLKIRMVLEWLMIGILVLSVAEVSLRGQTMRTSTAADRQSLALTVYNSGIALVRDTRRLDLPQGSVRLQLSGIAQKLQPQTVQLTPAAASAPWTVLEQNYLEDTVNPQRLLEAYVGKLVTLVRTRLENNSEVEVPIQARLLAAGPEPVWEIEGKVVTGLKVDHYVFPGFPSTLSLKPALVFLLQNYRAGEQTAEVSYLTDGINWNADYVLMLAASGKRTSLQGWVTLRNDSGLTFPDTSIQLVAGEVHRVYAMAMQPQARMMTSMAAAPPTPGQFTQQPFSSYHLYTLQRRTTLPDHESKQISLLSANHVSVTRTYEVNGRSYYYRNPEPGAPFKDPVEVRLRFENSKQNALGMPLPAGIVRIYQNDSAGHEQFLGEDRINHTPAGEMVDLDAGNAFDMTEERKQTDFQRLGQHSSEMTFEIVLRNHQSQPVQVAVNEPFGGDWELLSSSFPYQKTSAFSAQFIVPVAANGEALLRYRVRVRWGG